MAALTSLYEKDFFAWTQQQAKLIVFPPKCEWAIEQVLNEEFFPN